MSRARDLADGTFSGFSLTELLGKVTQSATTQVR
jgi:hypothetical protein